MQHLSYRQCLGLDKVDRNYYDALSDAGLPSMSSVYGNLSVPTSLNDIGGSAKDFAAGQNANTTGAFNSYMDYAKSLPTPLATYNQLEQQNGIPQLRQTAGTLMGDVNGLQQTIDRVEPNVNQNTSNSLATESQREGMVTAQKYPLQQQLTPQMNSLSNIESQLGNAESNVGTVTGLVTQGNQQMLDAAKMGISVAQDNAARSMTGFTTDQENTMNMLFKKLDVQQNLDNQEWSTLSMLAGKKLDYQNQVNAMKQQAQLTPTALGQTGSVYYDQNGKPQIIGGYGAVQNTPGLGSNNGRYSLVP